MRKIYSFAAAAMCSLSVFAGNYEVLGEINRESLREPNPVTLEMAPASQTPARAMALADNAPASITGKTYVTTYTDGEAKYNGFISVEAAGDSILLVGFAGGYDVKAAYDAATGTITIPTEKVIANHSTYGPITMWALDAAAGKYNSNPIIGTVDGNGISFNLGVYCTITMNDQNYYVIWMQDIKANEANGSMTGVFGSAQFEIPLLVSKSADNSINIIGMSSLLYGSYYSVPATFDAAANTATISPEQPIDANITSTATQIFYLFGQVSGGLSTSSFTVSTTDNSSVLTATSDIFIAYPKSTDPLTGQTTYSGYKLPNFKINVDFNIYTAKVEGGSEEFDPNPTINNVNYTLYPETKTAEVTGCLTGIASISIPATLTVQNTVYTVTAVKAQAFYANRSITAISLPATLQKVGTDAFRNVSNLRTLHIEDLTAWCGIEFANGNANPIYNVFPTSESKWGKVYFNGTLFEGELTIPAGVTSIGRSFYGLKNLTKVTLPDGLKTIGDQAFANTTKLTEITIPSSVTSVGSAFFGCSGLASVNLSEGLETMGNNMFYGCKALTSITIPASVKTIGSSTFMSCSNIATVKSLSTVPPVCASDLTFDYCSTAKLMVPAESINAYKEATGWKVFTNVEALQTTGIDNIEATGTDVPAEYYNLQGQKVAADNLTPGIYVKRQGTKATKIYVK